MLRNNHRIFSGLFLKKVTSLLKQLTFKLSLCQDKKILHSPPVMTDVYFVCKAANHVTKTQMPWRGELPRRGESWRGQKRRYLRTWSPMVSFKTPWKDASMDTSNTPIRHPETGKTTLNTQRRGGQRRKPPRGLGVLGVLSIAISVILAYSDRFLGLEVTWGHQSAPHHIMVTS